MASQTERQSLDATRADHSFFGHPRGLATLFFTEMWERFSYYGMRALLFLFMVDPVSKGGLGFSVVKAGAIYGLYTAMVYVLNLPGGWVADRLIGQRRAVLYGGILISIGEFCLVAPSVSTFYLGLVLLMMGTGLLKANVSTIVGQIYGPGDHRRDSGFSIFYMGINLGALISPLACGAVAHAYGWRMGFGVAGIGMIAGLVQYVLTSKHLGPAGLHPTSAGSPEKDRQQKRNAAIVGVAVLALCGVIAALGSAGTIQLTPEVISNTLGYVLLLITVAVFWWLIFGKGWTPEERKRSIAILVLFLSSAIFWAAFEQAGSSLNLFAERSTVRNIFGYEFPASWFQSVQPIFVIALSPVFAWLWLAMGKKEPSSPAKFSLGLLFGGLAFLLLVPAAQMTLKGTLVSPWWLIGTYLLQTLGELCLSPVGLSAMTKLAPARLGGFVMGMWFLSTAIGNWLAGKAGSLYEAFSLPDLFLTVGLTAIAAAVLLAILIKPTVRLMSGVK